MIQSYRHPDTFFMCAEMHLVLHTAEMTEAAVNQWTATHDDTTLQRHDVAPTS